MLKKVGAVSIGVFIGLAFAFARAGAFQLWGAEQPKSQSSPAAQTAQPPQSANNAKPAAAPAPANQPEPGEKPGVITSFAPLVKHVMPTVVNVAVVQDIKVGTSGAMPGEGGEGGPDEGGGGGGGPDLGPGGPGSGDPFEQFRRFFGQVPHDYKQKGLGSGVIITADGYILTNNHVVGGAEDIHVTLMDKREFTAKVIGKDLKTDLALIKIDSGKEPLPVAELGDSDTAEVGDWVLAIGNPFGFTLTTTAGIVSAKGRKEITGGNYDDFIQTDASINPGNSGGPLFNTSGQVIGINTAIYSRTGTNAGIGFAIPANLAKHVMDQLRAHGRVVRGWLGVEIQPVTADLAQSFGLSKAEGALVASTEKDGPAAKAGIERGDVIIKFDGKDVRDEHDLPVMVADTAINKKVPVELVRNTKHKTIEVTVGELKEAPVQTAKAEEPGTNWGMQVGDITPEIASQFHLQQEKGVVVRHVAPDSPAADASLQPGDVILEVNHEQVKTVNDFLAKAKSAKTSNKSSLLLVQRGGTTIYTVIKSAKG